MSKPKTLNDKAWENLFDKYNILNKIKKDELFIITSKQINEFREARLMTKFDHRINLPILFEENKLGILPITRGSYVISNFETYHEFEPINSKITKVKRPNYIHSIDFENITSEATALNAAFLSGILADFSEEENLFPTVDGRMSSESFELNINNTNLGKTQSISVVNSQIEIDGGYEGFDSLSLIEAKNSLSKDFLIRQLYYPYRLWEDRVRKPVKSIFLTYTNGVFNLYEYMFEDYKNYNSVILTKQKNYTLEDEDIEFAEINNLFKNIRIINEPQGIPFPQADAFERVINICELLNDKICMTREEITYNYDFDIRQTNYYTDACRYLGLLDKENIKGEGISYYLTEQGKDIFQLSLKQRNLYFVKLILEKKAFNLTFKKHLTDYEFPSREKTVEIMKKSNLYNINSDTTYYRRASTVSGWINWILDLSR